LVHALLRAFRKVETLDPNFVNMCQLYRKYTPHQSACSK